MAPECTTGLRYADGRPIPDEAWPECYDGGGVGKYKPTLEQMERDLRRIAEVSFPRSESPSKSVH